MTDIPYIPCLRSGMCCKKRPCPYGEVTSPDNPSCRFLEVEIAVEGTELYRCGKYEEISKQPGAEFSPAFGAGCCQPMFNDARNKIARLTIAGKIDRRIFANQS